MTKAANLVVSPTTLHMGELCSLIGHTNLGVMCAAVGQPHMDESMLDIEECNLSTRCNTVCAEVHLTSLSVSSSTPLSSGVGRLYEPQEPWGCTLTQSMEVLEISSTLTQNMGLDGTAVLGIACRNYATRVCSV